MSLFKPAGSQLSEIQLNFGPKDYSMESVYNADGCVVAVGNKYINNGVIKVLIALHLPLLKPSLTPFTTSSLSLSPFTSSQTISNPLYHLFSLSLHLPLLKPSLTPFTTSSLSLHLPLLKPSLTLFTTSSLSLSTYLFSNHL